MTIPTDNLPFHAFRNRPELRAAGLTPADLHDAARGFDIAGLKHWPMIDDGRVEPHTSPFYVREWIERRRSALWARRMAGAPLDAQEIERLIT